jgi:hypothetical protein
MGASAWFVVGKFDGHLEGALRAAKREVFNARTFYDAFGVVSEPEAAKVRLAQLTFPPGFPEEDAKEIAEAHAEEVGPQLQALDQFVAATDLDEKIEALRRAVGFEGTHSIIDLRSVDALQRIEDVQLVRRFGTLTPKVAAVRVASDELTSLVTARFGAVWLVALDECGAACVCFVGVSGD